VAPEALAALPGPAVLAATGDAAWTGALRRALAGRAGPIVPLVMTLDDPAPFWHERHLCIDTTAAGGNASLLAAVA
jgi:RHH-type proline utilization regulon transcriptional repressor/proline dehydrogenase/delta 1-pyrroline-5-carboxylate dehydrogenase